ncbi:hypothetical protein [Aromatoleum aromaticum]|uniref:hypothetical protein n=1 Tax=Aromatoleum aromaticum TaxID=551760 RepID=UPI001459BB01|nr:hypothetical protein [Aromatoleum aromaticum]NMG56705.1 hypothetical protein [Aromatoleum aromaticum]
MKPWLLPSGHQRGIPFIVPDHWTPEQALAVVELLDDLRERIWAHYQIPLHELMREEYAPTHDPDLRHTDTDDPPF